jgi:hypothetical protein
MVTAYNKEDEAKLSDDERVARLQSLLEEVSGTEKVKFAVGQVERAPSTSRLHLQCYVVLTSKLALSTVVKLFKEYKPHCEVRRGTHKEAVEYCSKEDTRVQGPWTHGTPPPGAGFRTDLLSVAQDIENGSLTSENIREEAPATYCRNRNGILDLLAHAAMKRSRTFRQITTYVYYGEAGVGKSRKAHEENPDAYTLETSACGNNIWFDGYNGQKVVIVDDYYGWMRFTFLLKFLDGYQLRLPIKGGHTWAEYETVIFTSNSHPGTWYGWGDKMSWAAFKRRISAVYLFREGHENKLCTLPDQVMDINDPLSY